MWLVTTAIAAGGVTVARFVLPNNYKLGFLALMLWGAVAMILVDHLLGYEGGMFFAQTAGGATSHGLMLGGLMLIPVFVIWGMALLILNLKRR